LFGNSNNNTSSLFGQQQHQQQQQNTLSFGNNQAGTSNNPLTLSQLGSQPSYQQTQNKPFQQSTGFLGAGAGASTSGTNGRDNNAQKRLGIPVNDKLEAIRAAWDVRDIQSCRFLVSLRSNPSAPDLSLSLLIVFLEIWTVLLLQCHPAESARFGRGLAWQSKLWETE